MGRALAGAAAQVKPARTHIASVGAMRQRALRKIMIGDPSIRSDPR